jgi:hypothetical protein
MDPADLLYADVRRIEQYFGQIGGRTDRLEWKGKIKLSSKPSAEIEAKKRADKPSLFAKIEGIEKYLERNSLLRFARPESESDEIDFVQEICRATKIEVPARRKRDTSKKMTLWISSPELTNDKVGVLVLLEDFGYPDERPTTFKNASGFSVLSALVYNTRNEIDDSVLGEELPRLPRQNPNAEFGTETHPASLYEHQNVKDYIYEFATNPIELLRSWRCRIQPDRRVRVVYKVREWGRDDAHHWEKITVFGYPIWIFASA